MADILTFPQDGGFFDEESAKATEDLFLKDEGLELLAAYRSIQDPAVRASLMQLVKTLAARGSLGVIGR